MILSAILKLDAGAFTTPLGKAVEGIKGMLRISGDLSEKLGAAFDAGGALSDLASQTGEGAGSLMVLRQAFEDCGVGADALGQTLAIMRRSLGGISETGEPTGKIFKQLGLDINALQGLGAREQLAAIGAAVSGLKTPAEQSAAAMAVFGRSGSRMLTLLKDPEALGAAAESLGGLPALMDRNAAAFDAVSDRMGRIKEKSNGLWAGIAEGLLPLADQVTATMDGIDLTGLGQRIGDFIGTMVEMFKVAPAGQNLKDGIIIGLAEAVNWSASGFVKLGGYLWQALSTPLSYFSAAFGKMIQEVMELIGKIPKVGKLAGLDGFKAQTFEEIRQESKDSLSDMVSDALGMGKVTLIDVSAEKERLGKVWHAAAIEQQRQKESIQNTSGAAAPGAGSAELTATKSSGKEARIDTDSLARIGGYLGASGGKAMEAIALRTAKATELMVRLLRQGGGKGAVWAT